MVVLPEPESPRSTVIPSAGIRASTSSAMAPRRVSMRKVSSRVMREVRTDRLGWGEGLGELRDLGKEVSGKRYSDSA